MHLIALDTVQITSVKSQPLLAGEGFEVSASDGKSLIERGLAREASADDAPFPEKAEETKAEVLPVSLKPALKAKAE